MAGGGFCLLPTSKTLAGGRPHKTRQFLSFPAGAPAGPVWAPCPCSSRTRACGASICPATSTENTTIKNNIFYSTHANSNLLYVDDSHLNLDMNFNHYYSSSSDVKFYWKGSIFSTFEQYKQNTGCDLASAFSNPLFIDTEVFDFQLQSTSPCIDTGDPAYTPA